MLNNKLSEFFEFILRFLIFFSVHGVWKYIRSCAYLGEPGIQGDERFCLMRTGTYNIFMEYCTCNSKDGCNISSHLKASSVLLGGTTIAVVFFKILR